MTDSHDNQSDPDVEAAREFARGIAGEDKVKFIYIFQKALQLAQMTAKVESKFADVLSRESGRSENLIPKEFFLDMSFVETVYGLINNKTFILGGKPAVEFPDCVAVGPPNFRSTRQFFCSGTLIAPNAVLTARHCSDGAGYAIFIGEDTNGGGEFAGVHKREIPDGFTGAHDHDLAILILKDKVISTPWRGLATNEMIEQAETITVAGFGSTEPGTGGAGAGKRRQGEMAIKSKSCSGYDPVHLKCHRGLEMAAIGVNVDSCDSDSGGPAYVKSGDKWYLAGITSRHINESTICGSGSIYVRVDKYRTWIDKILKENPA